MVNLPRFFNKDKEQEQASMKIQLPLLPLRDVVVFPYMIVPLFVGRSKSVSALASAMSRDKNVFLATQKTAGEDNPEEKDISVIGTVGRVLQLLRLPDGTVKALVEGKSRGRIVSFSNDEDLPAMNGESIINNGVKIIEKIDDARKLL